MFYVLSSTRALSLSLICSVPVVVKEVTTPASLTLCMQQVALTTPHPGNGCYLDTTRRSLLFLLSYPSVCFKGRWLLLFISCSTWSRVFKAERLEHTSPWSRQKCSLNRQVAVLTVGKNILGTSSSLSPLGRVNPSIARPISFAFCGKVRIKQGLLGDGICYL